MSAREARVQIPWCSKGLAILLTAELFCRTLFSFSWVELHRIPRCAWAGMGGKGLVAWWLGLKGEGRLVSRQSSGWIKSSLLWVGEEGSRFLSVPVLLMLSALRLTHSGAGHLARCLWLGVCSGKGWCLLSLLLRADSLPALVTHLKPSHFLTSDCKVKPFMKLVTEIVPRHLVLLCSTFFSLELADRQQWNIFTCWNSAFISGSTVCLKGRAQASQRLVPGREAWEEMGATMQV